MVAIPAQETYTFRDAKGDLGKVSVYVLWDSGAPANGIGDAHQIGLDLIALTNAALQNEKGPFSSPRIAAVYGSSSGDYVDAEDKAVFFFADSFGSISRVEVPAPNAAIFAADQETVDTGNANVANFVSDVTHTALFGGTVNTAAPLQTRDGRSLTLFYGGFRKRRKMQRKLNILVKRPDLGGPAE